MGRISWVLLAVGLWSCAGETAPAPEPGSRVEPEMDPWTKRWWLEKSADHLWAQPPLPGELDHLSELSREDGLTWLMQDPRFGDGVLSFNMFFLGWPIPELKGPHPVSGAMVYQPRVTWRPQALVSARSVLEDGDYFSLFDAEAPWVSYPATFAFLQGSPLPPEVPATQENIRAANFKFNDDALSRVLDLLQPASGPPDMVAACTAWFNNAAGGTTALNYWLFNGLAPFEPGLIFTNALYWDIAVPAFLDSAPNINFEQCLHADPASIVARVALERATIRATARIVEDVKPSEQRTILDIPLIDPATYDLPYVRKQFSPSDVRVFENSSTNLNRRRAAHVLKTFFCDDLTPITIPSDDEGDGEHGTNPACKACHYKLDPIAGFFRYTDANGLAIPTRPNIYFSDGVVVGGQDYQNYLDHWRPKTEGGRLWEVGYIRSTSRPEINSYGETLADLAAIVRHAPEVRNCLARRLTQYYLGDQQTVDPAWIAELARKLEPGPTSARNFKEVVTDILLSKTFSTRDADPHTCYDRVASDDDSAVPCAIAHVVETNCAECHQDANGGGRLDLTRWVETPDGFGFAHLDRDGAQRPAKDTFARMVERLSTTDARRAMPLLRYIDTRDRQDLFRWLSEQLEATP